MADGPWIFRWKDVHNYSAGHIMNKGIILVRRVRSNSEVDLILLSGARSTSFHSNCFWFSCLLGYSRFPYQEDRTNAWFVQRFRSKDGREQRVNVMNVNQEGIRTYSYCTNGQARNLPGHSLSDDQFDVFFHGTSHKNAQNIIENGINLKKARKGKPQDLSDGDGYYLCDSFDVAYDWGRRKFPGPGEGQAVLMYRVNKILLRGEDKNNGLDLRNDETKWLEVVREYRKPYCSNPKKRGSKPDIDKALRKELKNDYQFIEGPITSDPERNPSAAEFYSETYQLCIRQDNCAQLFNNSLHSVVFFRDQ